MVILTSGMLNPGAPDGLQGTELAQAAFKASLGSAGMAFVAICMLFFAFSTIIGWYFFGEQNVKALFGHKAVKVYAAIVVICIVIGSALHVDLVWNLSDLFNGLMVFPNLIALHGLCRNRLYTVLFDRKCTAILRCIFLQTPKKHWFSRSQYRIIGEYRGNIFIFHPFRI